MAAAHKWVYQFSEGSAKMRDLLGGKGAGAAEMTRAGMPVPPGFTLTTEACREYYARGRKLPEGLWEQVLANLKTLERKAGKRFAQRRADDRAVRNAARPALGRPAARVGQQPRPAPGEVPHRRRPLDPAHATRRMIRLTPPIGG